MNSNDLQEALQGVAERGEVRGADAVFLAATEGDSDPRRYAGSRVRRTNRRNVMAAAAAVVAILLIAIGVARRDGDPLQVQTTPTPASEPTRKVRVGYRDTQVNPSDASGKSDTAGLADDLARTVHARLTAYVGREVEVSPDGTGVVASVPASIPPELVDLLLLPIGRLALDQLGQPFETATCTAGLRMTNVATRSGAWPSWGPPTGCWSTSRSDPVSLVWSGRDLITTPAPGAHIEVRSNGATSDVVVDLPTQANSNESTACAAARPAPTRPPPAGSSLSTTPPSKPRARRRLTKSRSASSSPSTPTCCARSCSDPPT